MANPEIIEQDNRPLILDRPLSEKNLTVLQDAGGVIPVGAVMGVITMQTTAASVVVSAISGTGNGTCVKDATTPVLAGAIPGAYRIECVGDGADHNSLWIVKDPNGVQIGSFEINTIGGSFTFENQIKFVLTEGSTDFASGDFFTFTVAAGSGKLKRSVSTAVDGSQYPKYVNTVEIDATAGDVTSRNFVKSAYVRAAGLVFTGAETSATVVAGPQGGTFAELLRKTGFELITGDTLGQFNNNN